MRFAEVTWSPQGVGIKYTNKPKNHLLKKKSNKLLILSFLGHCHFDNLFLKKRKNFNFCKVATLKLWSV